jgi:EAL domain-containing protein (putative c-di-GMP-specific phosphodiesterase class I)
VAAARGELVVEYQPIIDVACGRIMIMEALARWVHPKYGRLGPDQFIPLAEETGAIRSITASVVEQALQQQRAWRDEGHDVRVSVNLSASSLAEPDLTEGIAAMLVRAGVAPERLVLEITESSLMAEPERTIATLTGLTELGVGLAIDDFGTGYSSLSHLQQLPVHALKIDKSFVTGLCESSVNAVIVRSIVDLGLSLGLTVIAEGVEDRQSLELLKLFGCRNAQGFYVSRPMPAEAVMAHLSSQPSRPVPWAKVVDLSRSRVTSTGGGQPKWRSGGDVTSGAGPAAARR